MAIELPKIDEYVEVPLRMDSALNMTDEEYDLYLENLDDSLLKFNDGEIPTIFKMRKVLPYRLSQKVDDMKMKMEYATRKGGEAKVSPRMAWLAEEVRCSLVDVVNPPNVPLDKHIKFKQDGDGGADQGFMAQLVALGVVMDLYTARNSNKKKLADKKK